MILEAGPALDIHPEKTIVMNIGERRRFSDVEGVNLFRADSSAAKRQSRVARLRIAGFPLSGGCGSVCVDGTTGGGLDLMFVEAVGKAAARQPIARGSQGELQNAYRGLRSLGIAGGPRPVTHP